MPYRLMTSIVILSAFTVACAPAPDFAPGNAANAPFPDIVPVSNIQAAVPAAIGDDGIPELAARAADLRARAAALRRTSVVDPSTEADMQDALDQQ